jgi:CIC family chloride channel protein
MLTTTFTISSGGSGGLFGPSIVIGGCLGGTVAIVAQYLTPFPIEIGAFVLVGMAAFFACAAKTPISMIIMVSEITGNYHLLVPTMWVCVLAYILNRDVSLFKKQLPTRFDAPAQLGNMMSELLVRMQVKDAYQKTKFLTKTIFIFNFVELLFNWLYFCR